MSSSQKNLDCAILGVNITVMWLTKHSASFKRGSDLHAYHNFYMQFLLLKWRAWQTQFGDIGTRGQYFHFTSETVYITSILCAFIVCQVQV